MDSNAQFLSARVVAAMQESVLHLKLVPALEVERVSIVKLIVVAMAMEHVIPIKLVGVTVDLGLTQQQKNVNFHV